MRAVSTRSARRRRRASRVCRETSRSPIPSSKTPVRSHWKDESTQEEANPYDTASWELDLDKGLRRVEDDKTVTRERGKSDANNPYNTGAFRKGW